MEPGTTRLYRWTEMWERLDLNIVEYEFLAEIYLAKTPQKDDIVFLVEGTNPVKYRVHHRVVGPHEVKVIVKRA